MSFFKKHKNIFIVLILLLSALTLLHHHSPIEELHEDCLICSFGFIFLGFLITFSFVTQTNYLPTPLLLTTACHQQANSYYLRAPPQ